MGDKDWPLLWARRPAKAGEAAASERRGQAALEAPPALPRRHPVEGDITPSFGVQSTPEKTRRDEHETHGEKAAGTRTSPGGASSREPFPASSGSGEVSTQRAEDGAQRAARGT